MSAALRAVLVGVCPRVYADYAPAGAPLPYITYQRIYGMPIRPLGKEVPDKVVSVYQVNAWDTARQAVDALAWQIDAAMRVATAFDAQPETDPVDVVEDDAPEIRGTRQEFRVIANR